LLNKPSLLWCEVWWRTRRVTQEAVIVDGQATVSVTDSVVHRIANQGEANPAGEAGISSEEKLLVKTRLSIACSTSPTREQPRTGTIVLVRALVYTRQLLRRHYDGAAPIFDVVVLTLCDQVKLLPSSRFITLLQRNRDEVESEVACFEVGDVKTEIRVRRISDLGLCCYPGSCCIECRARSFSGRVRKDEFLRTLSR